MTTTKICAGYQALVRRKYPDAIVLSCVTATPYDDVFDVFFIPDEAAGEYARRWLEVWYDEAERMGLPEVTLVHHYTSDTRKHYGHLFPKRSGLRAKRSRGSAQRKSVTPAAVKTSAK